ncbi:MAG: peptide chain release factor 2 [bacterium]
MMDLLQKINELEIVIKEIRGHLDLENKKLQTEELEKQIKDPSLWQDKKKMTSLNKEFKDLKIIIIEWDNLQKEFNDLKDYLNLINKNNVEEVLDLEKNIENFELKIKELEIKNLFKKANDESNAFLEIHPGAGGVESCDWAEMLMRMYVRWIENNKFKYKIIDFLSGEETGIKSVTILVIGKYANGYLKSETGIHRLVRISPFDANKRRHTSFASVFVFPETKEEQKIQINSNDLKIETFRASGHGGQHVNVTDSAVRLTHLPTKITAQCQNERSQHQNKAMAMKVLISRISEFYKKQQEEKLSKTLAPKKEISWGNQIRSYILHPYKMIKDHRTGIETGKTTQVLNGDLNDFMLSFLKIQKEN